MTYIDDIHHHKWQNLKLIFVNVDENPSWYHVWIPFYQHGYLIPAWISHYIHYKVWDEITYPFPNFSGAAIEVWE